MLEKSQFINKKIILIMGGASSGKSDFACNIVKKNSNVIYYSTLKMPEKDAELIDRIKQQQHNRPLSWLNMEYFNTIEQVLNKTNEQKPTAVIIDCLSLWLGLLLSQAFKKYSREQIYIHLESEIKILFEHIHKFSCPLIIVTNECGLGLVPEHHSGRLYRNYLGKINKYLSQKANLVVLCLAGIPLLIKNQVNFSNNLIQNINSDDFWSQYVL